MYACSEPGQDGIIQAVKEKNLTGVVVASCTPRMACAKVENTCFCHWVGSGPADPAGSDVLLTPVGDGYTVEAVSDKGAPLLDSPLLTDGAAKAAEAEAVKTATREALGEAPDISSAPQALLDAFNDMLSFSRPHTLAFSPISLNEVVTDTLNILRGHLEERGRLGLTLTVNLYEGLPLVAGDEAQLKQVLLNLLTNSMCPECRFPLCGFGKS